MFGFKKKQKVVETEFKAVVTGTAKALTNVEDEVFSKEFYAPISGTLSSVFPTGHAYGIQGDDGIEVFIHIGIDTVQLNGDGFDVKVKQDTRVNQGDLLVVCDIDKLKSSGFKTDTIVIVTNHDEFPIEAVVQDGQSVVASEDVILKRK